MWTLGACIRSCNSCIGSNLLPTLTVPRGGGTVSTSATTMVTVYLTCSIDDSGGDMDL